MLSISRTAAGGNMQDKIVFTKLIALRLRPTQFKKIEARIKKNPELNASSIIRTALDSYLK
jgi:hypothetical protein